MITAKVSGDNSGILSYLGSIGEAVSRSCCRLSDIYEIRIRAGRGVVLETVKGRTALDIAVSADDTEECIKNFCQHSFHSFEKELREGFITLKGGHRVGFCGTAVVKNGRLDGVKNISCINIRIAREVIGAGESLKDTVFEKDFKGLLICGRPMSGKTTVLRDLCRIIGNRHKLALIDERGEMAAIFQGIPQNNVGAFTDVLDGYDKENGIEIATRTLSPEYIVCDEITGFSDFERLCLNSGVKLIFTIHSGSIEQAKNTDAVKSGAISHIASLGGKIGQVTERAVIK